MIKRYLLTVASIASLAHGATLANAQQNQQGVRDILNQAQTQSDRKAVEDLIGRLRGDGTQPGAAPQPGQPATAPPGPAPAAVAPAPEPPAQAAAPPAVQTTAPPAVQTAAPPAAETAPPPVEQTTAPAVGSGGGVGLAAQPPPSPSAGTLGAPAPVAEPPPPQVAAPAPTGRRATRQAQPTAPVGQPIGPASAFPPAIPTAAPEGPPPAGPAPTDAEMARAPEIALERGMPTVDIEVLFGYDSTEITPEAAAGLKTLGEALADQRLAGQRFVIAGHTDARGRRDYNDYLSDRRAQAVRRYLIRQYRVPPGALIARGFGESRLKNPANPEGPENRRVQIINWSQPKAVSRRR